VSTVSWPLAFVWSMPMVGAYLWAAWASTPHWGYRFAIAAATQIIVPTTVHFLYDTK
jgi:hypothetical protein